MTADAEKIVRNWWAHDVLIEGKDILLLSSENQYNCRNMLAGFLQACEKFGHLTHDESQELFMELAK
jgi:hypothetical protein